jgi:hypothetical protein
MPEPTVIVRMKENVWLSVPGGAAWLLVIALSDMSAAA